MLLAPICAPIHAAVDPTSLSVEMTVDCLTATIQASVDSIAANVEPLRGDFVPGRCSPIRSAIELAVRAIAASVEPILDPVATRIETLLDPIAPAVRPLAGPGPRLRRAHEHSETDYECSAFHLCLPDEIS